MQHFLKVYSKEASKSKKREQGFTRKDVSGKQKQMLLHCPVKILKNTEQKEQKQGHIQSQKLFGGKLCTEQMSVDVALMKPCECYAVFPSAVKRQNLCFEIIK